LITGSTAQGERGEGEKKNTSDIPCGLYPKSTGKEKAKDRGSKVPGMGQRRDKNSRGGKRGKGPQKNPD